MRVIKIYTQPRVLLVFLLGILSGLPLALTASTVSIWLTEVGVSKAAIGLFAMVGTPYALKFLWAPLVDHLELPFIGKFGRRRAWLVFSQFVLVLALLGMAAVHPAQHTIVFALFARGGGSSDRVRVSCGNAAFRCWRAVSGRGAAVECGLYDDGGIGGAR